jgi:hypothetical protein
MAETTTITSLPDRFSPVTYSATRFILSGEDRDEPPNFITDSIWDFSVARFFPFLYLLDEVMVESLID